MVHLKNVTEINITQAPLPLMPFFNLIVTPEVYFRTAIIWNSQLNDFQDVNRSC